MTIDEAAKLLDLLQAYYPNSFARLKDRDVANIVKLWAEMFADDDTGDIRAAVMDYIATDTSSFMPNIAQIKDKLSKYHEPDTPTDAEAFEILIRARKRYNAYEPDADKRNEPFESLPEPIKRAIGGLNRFLQVGYIDTNSSDFGVARAQFMREYRDQMERKVVEAKRPRWLREKIKQISNSNGPLLADGAQTVKLLEGR